MLARVHSLLGLVPLGSFLLWHAYQTWPALQDREQWVDRALHAPARPWVVLWLLVPLVIHALLGLARMRRAPSDPLTGPPSLRAIQAVTGVVVLGFLLYHLGQVWGGTEGPHASPYSAYAALWQEVGRPFDLTLYLIGITAVCFHAAHGLTRAAVTFGLAGTPAAVRRVRFGAGALGFSLWLVYLQLLARFALGEPLFGAG